MKPRKPKGANFANDSIQVEAWSGDFDLPDCVEINGVLLSEKDLRKLIAWLERAAKYLEYEKGKK